MSPILHLDFSPRGSRSISRALTKEFVASWLQVHPQDCVTYGDIGKYPVPSIDEARERSLATAQAAIRVLIPIW